ncbi:hypothetical protein U1Q18_029107 [Sarracenia purpurea var. burkii]
MEELDLSEGVLQGVAMVFVLVEKTLGSSRPTMLQDWFLYRVTTGNPDMSPDFLLSGSGGGHLKLGNTESTGLLITSSSNCSDPLRTSTARVKGCAARFARCSAVSIGDAAQPSLLRARGSQLGNPILALHQSPPRSASFPVCGPPRSWTTK